ncbi:MAG: Arc family DNA-binding protein [Gammaproteobacteria bacterium]|nr:MAG: Arc family DNA-binding protein [Gammaproteobacteria bacterium]
MKEQPYKYMVRLPPAMRDQIRESARHYRRSMNSDIVARLQQTFSGLPDEARSRDLEPVLHEQIEDLFRRELSADEASLLRAYRRMSSKKREALKNLLL